MKKKYEKIEPEKVRAIMMMSMWFIIPFAWCFLWILNNQQVLGKNIKEAIKNHWDECKDMYIGRIPYAGYDDEGNGLYF